MHAVFVRTRVHMELKADTESVEAEEYLACEYHLSLRKQTAAKGQMSRGV